MLQSIQAKIQTKFQELKQQPVSKIIKKAVLITAVAVVAFKTVAGLAYLYNGTIDGLDCYPRSIFSFLRPKGMNLFCLARDMEVGVEKGLLKKIRDLYKQAFYEGVSVAKGRLCRPMMFPDAETDSTLYNKYVLYSEFGSICCPPLAENSLSEITFCPWDCIELKDSPYENFFGCYS